MKCFREISSWRPAPQTIKRMRTVFIILCAVVVITQLTLLISVSKSELRATKRINRFLKCRNACGNQQFYEPQHNVSEKTISMDDQSVWDEIENKEGERTDSHFGERQLNVSDQFITTNTPVSQQQPTTVKMKVLRINNRNPQ